MAPRCGQPRGVNRRAARGGARPGRARSEGEHGGPARGRPGRAGPVHFERSLSLDDARCSDALLAYAMNGELLPLQHGFPVRLVVPRWYAVTSVKWLTDISVTDAAFTGFYQSERYLYNWQRGGATAREPVTCSRSGRWSSSRPQAARSRPGRCSCAAWPGRVRRRSPESRCVSGTALAADAAGRGAPPVQLAVVGPPGSGSMPWAPQRCVPGRRTSPAAASPSGPRGTSSVTGPMPSRRCRFWCGSGGRRGIASGACRPRRSGGPTRWRRRRHRNKDPMLEPRRRTSLREEPVIRRHTATPERLTGLDLDHREGGLRRDVDRDAAAAAPLRGLVPADPSAEHPASALVGTVDGFIAAPRSASTRRATSRACTTSPLQPGPVDAARAGVATAPTNWRSRRAEYAPPRRPIHLRQTLVRPLPLAAYAGWA